MASSVKMTVGIVSALFIIHWFSNTAASETLIGSRESCTNEGGKVTVDTIKDIRCFTCMCKNGFVECQRERCPSHLGCFMLLEQERDQCCQLCKGCVWDGVERPSGSEWTQEGDPCRVFKCLGGVITEAMVSCYTPCPSPQPPRDGECCPSCKGCLINGQEVGPERDATIPEDPCLNCHCHEILVGGGGVERRMTCTKVACPVLQCPPWRQFTPPGHCCPTCKGSRPLRTPPHNKCVLVTELKSEGEVFSQAVSNPSSAPSTSSPPVMLLSEKISNPINQGIVKKPSADEVGTLPGNCTRCSCGRNGTVHCLKETCPVLECPVERRVWPIVVDSKGTKRRSCCMKCMEEQAEARRQCMHSGKVYKEGEMWALDACRSCVCLSGSVRCAMEMCPAINTVVITSKGRSISLGSVANANVACPPNTRLYHPKGTCCPTCVESDGVCSVFGDPHYRTFDGRFYSFQGACKYLLASDQCRMFVHHNSSSVSVGAGTFSIRVTNDARGTFTSSWTKTISIKAYGHKVSLGQRMRVKLNGKRVALPLNLSSNSSQLISVKKEGAGVVLWTQLGIMVIWDGNSFLEVSVPTSYKNKLCGLCGNYNDDPKDDLLPREGSPLLAKINEKGGSKKFGNNAPNHARGGNGGNVALFASSWRVGGKKACSRMDDAGLTLFPNAWIVTSMCRGDGSPSERRWNRKRELYRKCRSLRSPLFAACHEKVNPNMYMRSCLSDLCECPKGGRCHCSSLKAYAHACRRAMQSTLPAVDDREGEAASSPFALPREIENWRNSTGCLENEAEDDSSASEEELERRERRNRRRRKRKRLRGRMRSEGRRG